MKVTPCNPLPELENKNSKENELQKADERLRISSLIIRMSVHDKNYFLQLDTVSNRKDRVQLI